MDSQSMVECIEETGRTLNINNQGIVKYLCGIEEERNNLEIIIKKQFEEREQIESDIEKSTFKLCLINKSLAMRIKTKNNYEKTIAEIKAHYEQLVSSSNKLRQIVEKTQSDLDNIMNKKIGTGAESENDEIKILYVNSSQKGPDDCPCAPSDEPTKEEIPHDGPAKWNSNSIVREVRQSQESSKISNKKDSCRNEIADLSENNAQANGRGMTNNGIQTNLIKKEKSLQSEFQTESEIIHDNNKPITLPITELKNPSYNITSEKASGSTALTSGSGSITTGDSYVYPEFKFVNHTNSGQL